VRFDVGMVRHNLTRYNFEIKDPFINKELLCTCQLGRELCQLKKANGTLKLPKLAELHIKLFGKNFTNAHDALADTVACMNCFLKIKNINLHYMIKIINRNMIMKHMSEMQIDKITDAYNSAFSPKKRLRRILA
jgi:DNA polymerase III epsilon subunit-like protein